jgi:lipopolysaccharide/colanic/teichoic acid biosynthesis glycosyltransferase
MGERSRELLVLITGDIICFVISLYITLLLRYLEFPSVDLLHAHFGPFLILSGVWLFIFYVAGLYDKHTVFLKGLLFSRILNTQVVNILVAALLFLILPFGIAPKTNLIIYLVVSIVLITFWRLQLYNYLSPKHKHKAILIADGEEAIELVDEVNNNERYNYSFIRMIDEEIALHTPDFEEKLLTLIITEHISIIVANPKGEHIERVLPKLFDMAFLKHELTFLDFHKAYEDTFDRVALSALHYDWFITHVSQSKSLVYDAVKRGFDIVVSSLLLLMLLCMLPFVALALRLEGKGPVFISQDRIGKLNRAVRVWKIRTMTANDAQSGTWLHEDEKRENKITKVGAFLRKASIDELPQCINILKGEMSLIGPRNDIRGLGERLASEIPYYHLRNFVKPGVTGWAQTHQHYMGSNQSPQSLQESKVRLAYDLYYVKNRSLVLDMEIALRTIKTVLSRFITIRFGREY